MDRRKLLLAPIILTGLSIHKAVEAKVSSVFIFKNIFGSNKIQLGGQDSYHALAGKTFVLPKNPKHGEKYRFSVDCKSLEKPCRIIDEKYSVAGDKEEFILNTLAIFSLQFNAINGNWEVV